MSNFWDHEDQEQTSEYEMLHDEVEEAERIAEAYAQMPEIIEASDEELEEILESSSFDLDDGESNVIYNARLRLEQARLYEMLVNHDLFEGVEADPSAIKIVQNELKHYIVKRLEMLMGLRQPVSKPLETEFEPPFNDVEVDFLKQLAYKGTNGRSIEGEPVRAAPKKQTIKPVGALPSSVKKPLKSLGKPTQQNKTKQKISESRPKKTVNSQPIVSRTQKVKKTPENKPSNKIKGGTLNVREMTNKEAEAIAKQDIAETKNKKKWKHMTTKEKIAEIKRVNDKHTRKVSSGASLPFPTPEQLEMQYQTQQQQAFNTKGGRAISVIIDEVLKNKS
jgi:hypothetical protein